MAECKTCYNNLPKHTSLTNPYAKPKAGDVSICFCCGTISEFDNDLNLQPMSPQDIQEFENEAPRQADALYKASAYITIKNQQN